MTSTEPRPYFVDKARQVFTRAGGDPAHCGPVAAWAAHARQAGDHRVGVVVAETGQILADTRHVPGRVGATYIRAVTHDTDTHLVGREVGLAVGALRRAHGPAVHVRYSQVCQGAGGR